MLTVTIDIINDKAIKLLKDLENLQLIKMRKPKAKAQADTNWTAKYSGAMTKEPLSDIDGQLNELRGAWAI